MNRAQRMAIAERLRAIAAPHGAVVVVEDEGRETHVAFDFGSVKAVTWLGDAITPAVMVHWHGAIADLGAAFEDVNPHHHRKATLHRPSLDEFEPAFALHCEAVADGSAFI